MEPFIKAITEQIYEDIFLGSQKKFVKGKKVSNEAFVRNMEDLIKNSAHDKGMPDLFFNRVYKKTKVVGVLSGATFNKGMVTALLTSSNTSGKSVPEILSFGQGFIKDLFVQVATSTVTLYSTSIINNTDGNAVKQHIGEEVRAFFKGVREKYGIVDDAPSVPVLPTPVAGGTIGASEETNWKEKYEKRKAKYDLLKEKYRELKYSGKTKTVDDLLG